MTDIEKKVSVVLGGGNGIGAATCRLMAKRGWRVVVVDLNEQAANSVAFDIGSHGYCADISSPEAMEKLAADIERDVGPVHALVVCAAMLQERLAPEDLPVEMFRKVMEVNIGGTFYADRIFGTLMARRGRGAIVNIASTAAHGSQPLHAYGPSKAAVVNLTKALAVQWGKSGVRVNSVSPGATLVARVLARPPGRYATDIDSQMALGRRLQPEELAEAIEFLASDRASGITGIDLLVDAGMMAAATWGIYGGTPPPVSQTS